MKIQLYKAGTLTEKRDLDGVFNQLNKDLQLCGWEINLNARQSPEEQIHLLSEIIQNDLELQALLYRVDLDEMSLKSYFQTHHQDFPSFEAFILAALLGRAEQKVIMKKKFSQ